MEESVWPQWKTPSEIYTILYITMYTKAEFNNNCFIIHSKYFQFLTSLFPRRLSLFLGTVSRYKQVFFFLADTPQKVHHVNRAICFAYSYMSSVQLVRNSAISSSGSCGRHFFKIHSGINNQEPTIFTLREYG